MSTMNRQSGAVSLFMVVFAMLLMSVVTISFLRIMTADQQQASDNDLAQSAYDSAEAGVEDAKRAAVWYIEQCKSGTVAACTAATSAINSTECNEAIRVQNRWTDRSEVKVQSQVNEDGTSPDQALNQAYTCVTVQMSTDDYVTPIGADESILIPLKTGGAAFNSVTIEWYNKDDLSVPGGAIALDATTPGAALPLPSRSLWSTASGAAVNRPPVLRTQFMQVGDSFTLDGFNDTSASTTSSNGNTVFLYPSRSGGATEAIATVDNRSSNAPMSVGSTPLASQCATTVPSGGYACKKTLTLPEPVGGGARKEAYLRLTSFYVGAHVRITLRGDTSVVQFKDVQPLIDSTGRANDVFRRVQSRVTLYDTATFPYPDAAVDVTGSFCKNFSVTDTQYIDDNTCKP